jgi:hypothetical protein
MRESATYHWHRFEVAAELFKLLGETHRHTQVELWRSLTFPVAVDLSRRPHSPELLEHVSRIDQLDRREVVREPPGSVGFVAITKDDVEGLVDTLLWLYADDIRNAARAADVEPVDLELVDVSLDWLRSIVRLLHRLMAQATKRAPANRQAIDNAVLAGVPKPRKAKTSKVEVTRRIKLAKVELAKRHGSLGFGAAEIAEHASLSKSTVTSHPEWTKLHQARKELPGYRPGRRYRFATRVVVSTDLIERQPAK